MAYEILFIGLDQMGASIGMALADAQGKIIRVGFEPDRQLAKRAEMVGAVDQLVTHPRKAITSADLVIFSLPMEEVEVYLEHLGEKTKAGVTLIDTAQIKAPFFRWAKEYLPEGRSYIGLTPIVGPASLVGGDTPSDEPRPDLYKDGLLAIIAPPEAEESAVAVAINLATIIEATPFFIDLHEHDAALTFTEEIPILLSDALLQATVHSTSWRELERVAGLNFAHATSLCTAVPRNVLEKRLVLNRQKTVDKLDQFILELQNLREVMADEDGQGISTYLENAEQTRSSWLRAREQADWGSEELRPAEKIKKTGILANLLGLRRKKPGEVK